MVYRSSRPLGLCCLICMHDVRFVLFLKFVLNVLHAPFSGFLCVCTRMNGVCDYEYTKQNGG